MATHKHVMPARLNVSGVTAAYDRIAPIYDLWGRLAESKAHAVCLEWLDLRDVRLVLDVATGTGTLLGKVLERAPDASGVGVDLSPAMLRRARSRSRRRGFRLDLLRGDARNLPIRTGVADLLLNSYMFDLLPEDDFAPVLAEFSRVLTPGGRLALVNMTVPQRIYERIWETIYRIHPPLLGGCRSVSMTGPLTDAGFVVEKTARVTQMGFPSEVVLARPPADRGQGAESAL
jgi:ubiquinone/menaquinone biosynthesis C-methylase UbiE